MLADSNPIGLFITAIFLLITGITELVVHWSTVWAEIKEVFDDAVEFLRTKFGTLILILLGPLGIFIEIALHWQTLWDGIKSVTTDGVDFFTQTIPAAFDDVVSWFQALPGRVLSVLSSFLDTVFAPLLQAGTWLESHIWSLIDTWFVQVPLRIATALGDFFTAAFAPVLKVGTWLEDNVAQPVLTWFTQLPSRVATDLGDFLGTALAELAGVGTWLEKNVWSPIESFFSGLGTRIATVAGDMWDGVYDAFVTVFNDLIKVWNDSIGSVNFSIPGWVPGVGGDSFGFPKITPIAELTPTRSGGPGRRLLAVPRRRERSRIVHAQSGRQHRVDPGSVGSHRCERRLLVASVRQLGNALPRRGRHRRLDASGIIPAQGPEVLMAGAALLKLELGGLVLDLNDFCRNGFVIQTVDLGYATVRAVTNDLPGQDGADDQSTYFSSRTVQLSGAIVPSKAGSRTRAKDKLAPFLFPSARPTLVYALDCDVDARCLDMRVGQWSNPIDHPGNSTQFSVQWVCPNPISYGVSLNEVDLPLLAGSTEGFSFPHSFPLSFGESDGPSGAGAILNVGTYPSWPLLRIYGPCTDPSVIWVDPISGESLGIQVVFNGLVIADGDYVEVDPTGPTAYLNGDPMANQYNYIDFAATTWGQLAVGPNALRFTASGASVDCVCKVLWRNSYLD